MNLDGVRDALARVLADLGADVRIEVGQDEDGLTRFSLPNGSVHSTLLEPGSDAEKLVAVAHLLQNDINFWLPGAWGAALPPCPGHPHPADPTLVENEAWWICPRTRERLARIGQLG